MKMAFAIIAILLAGTLIQAGCKKPASTVTGGGKGGNAILKLIPEHAGLLIDSCMVYIKYNVTEAPADGTYDDSTWCVVTDTTPVATFSGLTTGNYYVLGVGTHPGYSPPDVRGGIPCKITSEITYTSYLPTYQYLK